MWKCKWGCDIFHHRSALSGDKPANAAGSKVLSNQISTVITPVKPAENWEFWSARKPSLNQELWTAESSASQRLCVVFRVWRRAARRGRGSRFQKWETCRSLMSRGWTVTCGNSLESPSDFSWGLCQIYLSSKWANLNFVFAAKKEKIQFYHQIQPDYHLHSAK